MAQSIGSSVAARVVKLAKAVEADQAKTLRKGLDAAKAEQERQIRRDSGGDMRLSGVGRRRGRPGGAKVGARYRVTSKSTGLIQASGPLPLINNPTKPHRIGSAYKSGASSRSVLNIPGIGYRRSAQHPGTKGKKTWQVGRKSAEPKIAKEMRTHTTAALARGMKG